MAAQSSQFPFLPCTVTLPVGLIGIKECWLIMLSEIFTSRAKQHLGTQFHRFVSLIGFWHALSGHQIFEYMGLDLREVSFWEIFYECQTPVWTQWHETSTVLWKNQSLRKFWSDAGLRVLYRENIIVCVVLPQEQLLSLEIKIKGSATLLILVALKGNATILYTENYLLLPSGLNQCGQWVFVTV